MPRYGKARPVSDPVASRNATLRMIERCGRGQAKAWLAHEAAMATEEHRLFEVYRQLAQQQQRHAREQIERAFRVPPEYVQPVGRVTASEIAQRHAFIPPEVIEQFNQAMRRMWEANPPTSWFRPAPAPADNAAAGVNRAENQAIDNPYPPVPPRVSAEHAGRRWTVGPDGQSMTYTEE